MKNALFVPLFSAVLLAHPAFADDTHKHGMKKMDAPVLAQAAVMAQGEVRKVDKGTGKITLKHGPIVNLDMPGMTMVFHVKDPAMLDQVKKGDKVKFAAEKMGDNFTVTKIEAEK